jgi:hypothetical protein
MLAGIFINLIFFVIGMVILYFVIRMAVKHGTIDAAGDMHITIRNAVKSALREYDDMKENNRGV